MSKYIKQKMFELKYDLHTFPSKIREKVEWGIAFILPKQIAYYATIRTWAHATTGEYGSTNAPSITVAEVLDRWDSV
jgi:hypothetical protein